MSATPATTPGRGSLSAETGAARAWRWLREHAVNIIAVLVLVYLLIPIVLIFVFSFNNPAGRYNFTWVGFTLKHWSPPSTITELTKALLESDQAGPAGDGDLDHHRHDDGDRPGPP